MKHLSLAVAALSLTLFAAPAAQAFTVENQDSGASGGSNFLDLSKPKITDPDGSISQFGSGKPGTYNFGDGGTLRLGTTGEIGSFDRRYNPSNLFDPYARNGRY